MKISPETYTRMGNQFKLIKSMSQSRFVNWICKLWQDAYDEGYNKAIDEVKSAQGAVSFDDEVDAEVMDADRLMEILLSVKGIGKKRAQEVIDKITKEGE